MASSTLALGCYATAGPAGPPPPPAYQVTAGSPAPADDIAYESAPPAQVETYPSVVYEGQPHYYVSGRWYVHTQRGWGYRRQEPPQLAQHRPPARREEPRREEEHHDERRDEHR